MPIIYCYDIRFNIEISRNKNKNHSFSVKNSISGNNGKMTSQIEEVYN